MSNLNVTPQQPNYAQPNYDWQFTQIQNFTNGLNTNLTNTNAGLATANGNIATNTANITTLQGQFAGLPTTFVTSLNFSAMVNGAILFAGSAVRQGGTGNLTFTFTPDGAPVVQNLPYVYVAGQTFLVLAATGAGQTFTLPATDSVPAGFCIVIHSGTAPGGNSFNVVPAGLNTFNSNGGVTYQINPLASTSYIDARFRSNGLSGAAGIWYVSGSN